MRFVQLFLLVLTAVIFLPASRAQAQKQVLWAPCYPQVSECINFNGDNYTTSPYAACESFAAINFKVEPAYGQLAPKILSFIGTYANPIEPFLCTVKNHYGGYANISVVCPIGTSAVPYSGGSCAPPPDVMNPELLGGMCPVPWATGPKAPSPTMPGDPSSHACKAQLSHSGNALAGDPVNVATGNMFYAATDYATAGQNTLRFTRYFNSRDTTFTSLGANWHSNFDGSIVVNGRAEAVIQRPDGPYYIFKLVGSSWNTNADIDFKLIGSGSSFTITDRDDNVELYTGSTPKLTSITARSGYKQTLSYNSDGLLASVTDSYNRTLAFTYDDRGMLQSLETPDGTTITYTFAAAGGAFNLTSVTYPTETPSTITYVYEDPAYLYLLTTLPNVVTGVIDENGNRYLSWTYDAFARAVTSQVGSGANAMTTSISYDDASGNRTVTNALGETDTYSFITLQTVPKVASINRAATSTTVAGKRSFTYDTSGYMASETDWNGNLTTYVNDSHGQPTTINEAVGSAVARTTTTVYDATWVHLPASIATPGLTAALTYDAAGEPLFQTLHDTTTRTVPYSTSGQARTWTNIWSNFLLSSVETPNGNSTEFSYDSSGALTSVTDALGYTTHITAHTGGGLPLNMVDSNGVRTTMTYDGRQRLLSSTLIASTGPLTTNHTYDPAGNLITTTLPDNSALTNTYDTAHRLTKITDLFHQSVNYTRDALGDALTTNLASVGNRIQRLHSNGFDALGRTISDVGGMGQTTSIAYDSNDNPVSIVDPLAHVTRRSFDALNRLSTLTDAKGGMTSFLYDAHDRPISVTDAKSNTTSYVYDGFGDLIAQSSPDSGNTIYHYDADGNLTQKLDASGNITNHTFDAFDRPLTTTYPSDPAENVAYTYDQSGHGFGIGRLTSLTDAAGALARTYDERGNILTELRTTGTTALKTAYTYDPASRIASITYPSGWSASYTRDIMGRIWQIPITTSTGSSAGNAITNATYEPFGPLYTLTFGNGVSEARHFDLDYRVTSLTETGSTTLENLAYGYDADDDVVSIADGVTPANSQGLGYDVLDRLTGAASSYGTLAYTYDPVGNRLSQTLNALTSVYTYLSHTNRLSSVTVGTNTQSFGYTPTGNINSITSTGSPTLTLGYNSANRYASEHGASLAATYIYDAFGQRAWKASDGLVNHFIYGQDSLLLEENDGSLPIDYVYLNGRPVAEIQPRSGGIYYAQDDRLGTPQMVTDGLQNIVWKTTYQPFGTTTSEIASVSQNLRLPGQYADTETGFSYNLNRNYITGLGRFVEPDPVGKSSNMNIYRYANDNPLSFTDPTGLFERGEDCTAGSCTPEPPEQCFVECLVGAQVLGLPADKAQDRAEESILKTSMKTAERNCINILIKVKSWIDLEKDVLECKKECSEHR